MSREIEALRALACAERRKAWHHARALPAHAGATASAFAREHPVLAAGGAAALAMGFVARRRRTHGREGPGSSWPMAVAAVASKFLPEILRAAGLALPLDHAVERESSETNGAAGTAPGTVHPVEPLAASSP